MIECRKIYYQDLDAKNFLDPSIGGNYPEMQDLHRMYIGKVMHCRIR